MVYRRLEGVDENFLVGADYVNCVVIESNQRVAEEQSHSFGGSHAKIMVDILI